MSDTHIHIHVNHAPVLPPWKINPASRPKDTHPQSDEKERAQIHKLIRCIVARDEVDYRTAFRSLYDNYERLHGQHPIVESFRAGLHSHLEWVCRQPEGLQRLLAIAEDAMMAPQRKTTSRPL